MTDREEGQGRGTGPRLIHRQLAAPSPRPSSASRGWSREPGSRCTHVAAVPRTPRAHACTHTHTRTQRGTDTRTDTDTLTEAYRRTHTHAHTHSAPGTLGTAQPRSGLPGATLGPAEGRQATPSLTVSAPSGFSCVLATSGWPAPGPVTSRAQRRPSARGLSTQPRGACCPQGRSSHGPDSRLPGPGDPTPCLLRGGPPAPAQPPLSSLTGHRVQRVSEEP